MFEIMKLKERKCGSQDNSGSSPNVWDQITKAADKADKKWQGDACDCQTYAVNKRKDKADNKLASKERAEIIIYSGQETYCPISFR